MARPALIRFYGNALVCCFILMTTVLPLLSAASNEMLDDLKLQLSEAERQLEYIDYLITEYPSSREQNSIIRSQILSKIIHLKSEIDKLEGNAIPKGEGKLLSGFIRKYLRNSKTWVVLIGIENYSYETNGYPTLPFAVNDAEDMKDSIIKNLNIPEKRIFTLLNSQATKKNIEHVLGDVLPKETNVNDRVLIYFSGHGETYNMPSGDDYGYLIPSDGEKNALYSTTISMNQISDFANIIPASQVLFIIDACYSGIAAIYNKSGDDDYTEKQLKEITDAQINIYVNSRGRQIMTAGTSKEKAFMGKEWENHSVYTYYLLRGLKGEADYNNDKVIATNELHLYVSNQVSRDTQSHQNPQLHSLSYTEGQFIFYREGDF